MHESAQSRFCRVSRVVQDDAIVICDGVTQTFATRGYKSVDIARLCYVEIVLKGSSYNCSISK